MKHQDWLCNIIDHHIKFHPSDDLQTFLTPLIIIWQLTHYDLHSLEAVSHSSLSQVIGSNHLSIYILFSHDESLCFVLLLIFFLIYHLICHPVLRQNFLEDSSDSLMSNHLLISEKLLSHSGFPSYKEAVLPQRKDNLVQVLFLAQLSSARSITRQF